MKLIEKLEANTPTLSYEVFPPKTDSAFESIRFATEEIAALGPAFMSVTYGAGGGTSRYTLEIAENLRDRFQTEALVHLTCISSDEETIREQLRRMKEAGLENVMALRGDLPQTFTAEDRPFRHASDLIRLIRQCGEFCIGGACYPETHPESPSSREDLLHLKEKEEAGCSFFTTQMFFENEILYRFLEKARAVGIRIPVVAGIMPLTNARQAERVTSLSGSRLPEKLCRLLEKYADSPEDMAKAGTDFAIGQMSGLLENGVSHIHVYTMNRPETARAIQTAWQNLL